jgi:hypothetical protein
MRRSVIIMVAIGLAFTISCNSGEKKENEIKTTENNQTNAEQGEMKEQKEITYKSYKNEKEIIKIGLSQDHKKVENATYQKDENSEELPIILKDFEYSEDMGMFLGIATCNAWESEMIIGLEGDLSSIGLNDGQKTKKEFIKIQ